jgi:hypothetical protein
MVGGQPGTLHARPHPDHDELLRELRLVARYGASRIGQVSLPTLERTAHIINPPSGIYPTSQDEVIRQAILDVLPQVRPRRWRDAATCLFGMRPGTETWNKRRRRRAAAAAIAPSRLGLDQADVNRIIVLVTRALLDAVARTVTLNTGQRLSPRSSVANFDPVMPDPLFADALSNSSRRRTILFLILGVSTLAWLISAYRSDLSLPQIARTVCGDFRLAIGSGPTESCLSSLSTAAEWPLWRDIYSFYAFVIMLLTPIIVAYQSAGIKRALGDMSAHGALRPNNPGALDAVNREIDRANAFYAAVRRYAWVLILVPTAAMLAIMVVQALNGVFIRMQPPSTSANWAAESYQNWWVNPNTSLLGAASYFLAGSAGLYVVTSQNVIGLRLIWAFWKVRNEVTLCADPINVDGYYGWLPVRTIYRAALLELTLHGVGLGLVGLMMPVGGWIPLGFASMQWLAVMPIYTLFPFVFARHHVRKYKESEIAYLEQLFDRRLNAGNSVGVMQDIETIRNQIASVRAVPSMPFFKARDGTILALSLIADSAAVSILVINLLNWST